MKVNIPARILAGFALASAVFGVLFVRDESRTRNHDHAQLLSLSYEQFDQTLHSGWRVLTDDKRLPEAAVLIESYLAQHSELDRFQRSNLHWHAVQSLALAGDTAGAHKIHPVSAA